MLSHRDVIVCRDCGSLYADVGEEITECNSCGAEGVDVFMSTELTLRVFGVSIDG
jgi:Zn finger protein HypA/HybF involved in hydrogenase expression